jgi:hypothetical protein
MDEGNIQYVDSPVTVSWWSGSRGRVDAGEAWEDADVLTRLDLW